MKSKGFTLIELVVVIVIMGILSALAIPKYLDLTSEAKKGHDRSQLGSLRSSTLMLYANNIINTNKPDGTNYWPSGASVWANLTSSNAWKVYTNVSYSATSGVWTATGE